MFYSKIVRLFEFSIIFEKGNIAKNTLHNVSIYSKFLVDFFNKVFGKRKNPTTLEQFLEKHLFSETKSLLNRIPLTRF